MAVAAGLIGCFAVMRRMALAGDALSHVALPGVGLALALHVHPVFGAAAMLFFGALLVWEIEDRSHVATETIVGVIFSAALAIGSMITSGENLIEALFGSVDVLSLPEVLFGLAGAGAVIAFVVSQKNALVVALVSRDIARTAGVDIRRLNLIYLQMFALTVGTRAPLSWRAADGIVDHYSGCNCKTSIEESEPDAHAVGHVRSGRDCSWLDPCALAS